MSKFKNKDGSVVDETEIMEAKDYMNKYINIMGLYRNLVQICDDGYEPIARPLMSHLESLYPNLFHDFALYPVRFKFSNLRLIQDRCYRAAFNLVHDY